MHTVHIGITMHPPLLSHYKLAARQFSLKSIVLMCIEHTANSPVSYIDLTVFYTLKYMTANACIVLKESCCKEVQ